MSFPSKSTRKKTHLEGLLEAHEKQYVNTLERFLG